MSNYQIVGQIKRQVDQAFQKHYTRNNQRKQLKHYSLYLSSIVKIQRSFRAYLMRKTHVLQREISSKLEQRVILEKKKQQTKLKIIQAQQKRQKLRMMDLNRIADDEKENINKNLQKIIGNVVSTADKYSQNVAVSKIQLREFKKLTEQEEQLQCEVKQLQLQKQCYQQRVNGWKEKLSQIRKRIIEENAEKRKIQEKIWKLG